MCCTCSSDPSVTFLETGSFIIWQRATEDCWRHDVRRVKKKRNISMMGCRGCSHGDRDADTNTTQGWHIHRHARVQVCKSLTLIDKYYTHMLNTHKQIAVYPSRVWFSAWRIAATFFPDTFLFQFGLWSEGGLVAARCNLPWEKKTLIYCSTFLLLLWFLTVHFTQPGSTLIAQKKIFKKKSRK